MTKRLVTRIISAVAGYLVCTAVLRKNHAQPGAPWRAELSECELRFQDRYAALEARVADMRAEALQLPVLQETVLQETMEPLREPGAQDVFQMAALSAVSQLEQRLAELEASRPWRADLDDLADRLDAIIRAHESATVTHLAEYTDKLARVEERIAPLLEAVADTSTLAERIHGLEQETGERQRRMDAAAAIATEVERKLNSRLLSLEEKLEANAKLVDSLGAATAETADALQKLTESAESRSRPPARLVAHIRNTGALGKSPSSVDPDSALERLFEVRL